MPFLSCSSQRRCRKQHGGPPPSPPFVVLLLLLVVFTLLVGCCCNPYYHVNAVAAAAHHHQQQQQQRHGRRRRRRVATTNDDDNNNDFATVNALLETQVMEFEFGSDDNTADSSSSSSSPPPTMEQSGLTATLRTLVCTGMTLRNVDMEWTRRGKVSSFASDDKMHSILDAQTPLPSINLTEFEHDDSIPFTMTILDLYFTCIGDFDFEFLWGTGQGKVYIETTASGNQVVLDHVLAIDDDHETITTGASFFVNTPPTVLEIEACNASIAVDTMNFELDQEWGLVETILNAMDLRDSYALLMEEYLCDSFHDDDDDENEDDSPGMLEGMAALIEPYLSTKTTNSVDDLLSKEAALDLPRDLLAVNFKHPATPISKLVHQLLTGTGDNMLSSPSLLNHLLEGLLFHNNDDDGDLQFDLESILLDSGGSTRRRHLQFFPLLPLPSPDDGGSNAPPLSDIIQQQLSLPPLPPLDAPPLFSTPSPSQAPTTAPMTAPPSVTMVGGEDDTPQPSVAMAGAASATSVRSTMDIPTPFGNVTVRFKELSILDSPDYSVLSTKIVGKHSLETVFQVQNVTIRLALEISSENLPNMTFDPQTLYVEVPVDPFDVSAAMLLVLDEDKIAAAGLSIGLADCLQSTIYHAELVSLTMSNPVVGLGQPRSYGLETFSPGVARVAAAFVDVFYAGFGPSMRHAIPSFVQTKMKEVLNERLHNAMKTASTAEACQRGDGSLGIANFGGLADLFGNDILRLLLEWILPSFGAVFDEKGSSIIKEGALMEVDQSIALGDADMRLQLLLDHFRIDNLYSPDEVSLLYPIPGPSSIINNSVTLGVSPEPLRMSASVAFGMTVNNKEIHNQATLEVDLFGSQLIAQIFAHISEAGMSSLSIQDLIDLDMNCILPRLLGVPILNEHGVRLEDSPLSLSLENVDLVVRHEAANTLSFQCVECQSPGFQEAHNLLQQPDKQASAIYRVEDTINWLLSTFVDGDSSYVQARIDRMLVDTSNQCDGSSGVQYKYQAFEHVGYDNDMEMDTVKSILAVLIAVGAVILFSHACCVFVRWVVTRRQRKWLRTLSSTQLLAVYQAQQTRDDVEAAINTLSKAMFQSKEVPLYAKCVIPIIIMGTFALFLLGHLSISGSARLYIQLVGEELVIDDVYNISWAQTCVDLWQSGSRALSSLLVLFSMTLPYVELLSMMVLWFLPPCFLSIQRRGTVLTWLHRLAKWCMVNVFIVILIMAAFRISIWSPREPFLPDLYKVDLVIAPVWGLYCNIGAQALLHLISHFIMMSQRKIQDGAIVEYESSTTISAVDDDEKSESEADTDELDETEFETVPIESESAAEERHATKTDALHECVFDRPHRLESSGLLVRRGVSALIISWAMIVATLVVAGCTLPSFTSHAQGIVGVLISFGREDGSSHFDRGVFSIAKLFLGIMEFLNSTEDKVGLFFVTALVISTIFLVPASLVVAQLWRWFYPLNQEASGRLDVWIEIFGAWQYLEVYIATMLLVVWQLADLSELVLNDYCDRLKPWFAEMAFFKVLSPQDAQCFRLQPSIMPGLYLLVGACILLAILRAFTSMAVHQVEYQESSSWSFWLQDSNIPVVPTGDEENKVVELSEIRTVPVLFSDRFRWLLKDRYG